MSKSQSLSLLTAVVLIFLDPTFGADLSADRIVETIDTDGGICVVLDDPDCRHAVRMAKETEFIVYTQMPRGAEYQRACRKADAAGFYGSRIFIGQGDPAKIQLGDNLADAVIVPASRGDTPQAELLRILRPGGKLIFADRIVTKPFPKGVDDWSHPYHGPDNNPQSADKVVVAPYLTQFLAEPRYAPLPQVTVASAGRVFKAFGHVAFKTREEPFLNKLVAFNGYNGTILWQRDLAEGVMIHRNTMVATPTRLYVGDDKSCKVIDTATGELADEIVPPADVAGGTFRHGRTGRRDRSARRRCRRDVLEMDGPGGRRSLRLDRRARAEGPDEAVAPGQARLALGADFQGIQPARAAVGIRSQRPGHRSVDREGAL